MTPAGPMPLLLVPPNQKPLTDAQARQLLTDLGELFDPRPLANAIRNLLFKAKHKPNRTGSIPNYRNPTKKKGGTCSYKGPKKDPDSNPFLPYLIPFLANPEAIQHTSDFIEGFVPGGPPPPTYGGLAGSIAGDLFYTLLQTK